MSDGGQGRSRGCATASQGGCAGCGCVLTIGLILALIGAAGALTFTVRVPATDANITLAGSIGKKELTKPILPPYVQRTIERNSDPINHSNSLTIGPAEGRQQFVVGKQPGSPKLGLDFAWKTSSSGSRFAR